MGDVKSLLNRIDAEFSTLKDRIQRAQTSQLRDYQERQEQTIADWVDDRIVEFVKTYLMLHENQCYLKDHMVEDPIAEIQLPKFAAAAQMDWDGKRYYFISEETKREFQDRHGMVHA